MKKQPRIGIVGGGPSGLSLARILLNHGIASTVFEREQHSAIRSQGGSLDMHIETGQFAIECAGLTAEFKQIARYEDQQTRIYDKHGTLRFIDNDTSTGDRPEVDRGHLRQMLLDSLPDDVIRWDHALSRVEPRDDGAFDLVFPSGFRETFDLVVGADGAWSRVRPLVSNARPEYSGVTFIELGIADADACYPAIARLVGHGLMFAVGDGKALIGHRDADAHVGIYAGLRVPEDWIRSDALDLSSGSALKTSLAAHFDGWSDDLLQLIHCSDQMIAPRLIHALPIGHRWENRPGVTLLGDAAHLMSPFSGEGANLAMRDAADLALALIGTDDWPAAVQGFEAVMFARAEEAAIGAKSGIDEAFADDGLEHIVRQMEGHHG